MHREISMSVVVVVLIIVVILTNIIRLWRSAQSCRHVPRNTVTSVRV